MKTFIQWLEDTGEVLSKVNDRAYANRGIGSKISTNDKKTIKPSDKPEKLFGFKKPK